MRVNISILYKQLVDSIAKKNNEIFKAHEELSTSKKINRPSDDVASYSKAYNYKIKLNYIEQFKRNGEYADGVLKFLETQLNNITDNLDRALELSILGLNSTEDNISRNAIGSELKNISDYILSIANSKYEGNFVFSGLKSNTEAYPTTTSLFAGETGKLNININEVSSMSLNISGDNLFSFKHFSSSSLITPENKYIYYNSSSDGSLNIEIRDTDNVTVLKKINVSNVMDGISKLSDAFKKNDLVEARALSEIISFAKQQAVIAQTEVGFKLSRLEKQQQALDETELIYSKLLSDIQDADITIVASEIASIQTALEALRVTAAKVFSHSLLDFLR